MNSLQKERIKGKRQIKVETRYLELRATRKELGLSQAHLALLLDCHPDRIMHMEMGRRQQVDFVAAVCEIFTKEANKQGLNKIYNWEDFTGSDDVDATLNLLDKGLHWAKSITRDDVEQDPTLGAQCYFLSSPLIIRQKDRMVAEITAEKIEVEDRCEEARLILENEPKSLEEAIEYINAAKGVLNTYETDPDVESLPTQSRQSGMSNDRRALPTASTES